MIPEINYSTQWGGTDHRYRFTDGQLIYRCGDSQLEFRLDLRRADYTIKQTRKFHRFWWVGLAGVAFPLLTFGTIYLKERVIDVGEWAWIHGVFLVVGVLLLLYYRWSTRCYEVRTGRGDRLSIIADPAQPGSAEQLLGAIRQMETELS